MNKATAAVTQANTGTLINFLSNDVSAFIIKLVGAIFIVVIVILLWRIIGAIVKKNLLKHADPAYKKHSEKVASLIQSIIFWVAIIFSIFIWCEMMGLDVALIIGWISFGVWLAFKEILGNIVAGMMILYTKELKLWDLVEIVADQDYFGRVEEITIRYTIIRTLDLKQVLIPNLTLISTPIKTFSAEKVIRLMFTAYVDYYSDLEKTMQVIKDAINSFDFIKEKESTRVYVGEFEDSEIWLTCICFYDPNCGILQDYVIGYLREAIYAWYAKNGINMAYPHITLTFDEDKQNQALQAVLGDEGVAEKTTKVKH